MARSTTERTVKTKFDGDAKDGIRAARAMERELKRLHREAEKQQAEFNARTEKGADKASAALFGAARGVLAIGSAVSGAQGLASVTASLVTLSGTALAIPGILAAGAAGAGVFKLALSGMGDAIKAKDLQEFNEVTKNMAPNAVATARAIRDQNDRFTDLRKTVQTNFFAGFDGDVRSLADKYFPMLRDRGGEIATEFNHMGREGAKALLAPNAVTDVNKVLGGTRDSLKELRPALGNVVSGLLDLSSVGASRLPGLSKAVTNVTEDFKQWAAAGVKTGRINALITAGTEEAKKFGRAFGNIGDTGLIVFQTLNKGGSDFAGGLIKTTQLLKDFVSSADGQRALQRLASALGTAADVSRNVFGVALNEAGRIIDKLGPGFEGFARGVGTFLVHSIETVGPLLEGLAGFLSDNAGAVEALTPPVLGLVLAYKGMKVVNEAKEWLTGLNAVLGNVTTSTTATSAAVGGADGKGGLIARLGGLKAIAGTLALGAAAKGLDDMNVSAAGSEENLKGVDAELHNIVSAGEAILSLDFHGIFKDLVDELHQVDEQFKSGKSPIGKLLVGEQGKVGFQISAGVDVSQAQQDLRNLTDEIGRSQASVTINGNKVPAANALKTVIQAIEDGKGTVDINGATVDAHRALDDIIALINSTTGTIKVDGNDVPAGQVLLGLLNRVNGSRAQMNIDANDNAAQGVVNNFIRMNNGRTIDILVNAKGDMGGIASAGRLASGGRPFDGRVRGPGTPTSDTAGLFRLSNEEHVLAGADVQAFGGHQAVYRMRALARQGKFRGFANGGTPAFLTSALPVPSRTPSVSVNTGSTNVTILIDGQEFRGIMRTEIDKDRREADRRARVGGGAL